MIIIIISLIVCVSYIFLMGSFAAGLIRLTGKQSLQNNSSESGISLIIPFRNEAENLAACIESVKKLDTCGMLLEVIFVDDHSEDGGEQIVMNNIQNSGNLSFKLIQMTSHNATGKKAAQHTGVQHASYGLLAFTDADCILPQHWISAMMSKMNSSCVMICGPVIYNTLQFSHHIFNIEFLSLVLSGAGAFGNGRPVFCNGANILIRKDAYQNVESKMKGTAFASGDDVFLLQAVVRQYGGKSADFVMSREALVQTNPPENFRKFFIQRIRWASKAVSYSGFWGIFTSLTVFFMSLLILTLFTTAFFSETCILAGIISLGIKIFCDMVLFLSGKKLYNKAWYPLLLIPMQLVYPLYVVIVTVISFFGKGKWKGRKLVNN